MARRGTPPTLMPARLSPDQMRRSIGKLDRRIKELQEFDLNAITDRGHPEARALSASIEDTLESIYGTDSTDYYRYRDAADLDTAAIVVGGTPLIEVIEGYERGIERAIALLTQARNSLTENIQDIRYEALEGAGATRPSKVAEGLEIISQRGRLEIADPPEGGPFRYNSFREDSPQAVAELTRALTEAIDAIKGDNSLLGEVLRDQLIVLLESATAELKAPYTDTSRLESAATTSEYGRGCRKEGSGKIHCGQADKWC